MSFISLGFFLFSAALFAAYFLLPRRFQWMVLLAASYVFYASFSLRMTMYLLFTTASVFGAALWVDTLNTRQKGFLAAQDKDWLKKHKKAYTAAGTRKKRGVMALALLANFGILFFLKYYDFFALNLNDLIGLFGAPARLPEFSLILPLGLSFYTFQAAGYLIDVYRGKYPADRNPAKFALFVSFFPQVVQGPISRHDQLAHQLYAQHPFSYTQFKYGVQLIFWGMFKKLLIGDVGAQLVNTVLKRYTEYAGSEIAVTVLFFMAQIYGDFSGGMDIARGIAQCMGIDMVQNFERPHFAVSVSDYWRRWHITLGSWMRDYVLYSISLSGAWAKLGKAARKRLGNYFGKLLPTCLAMFIVFMLVGIWHGPGWKYIAFGVYNGIFIVGGILMDKPLKAFFAKHPGINPSVPGWRVLAVLKTMFIIFISKFFACAPDFDVAMYMLKSTFTVWNPGALATFFIRTKFGYLNLLIFLTGCACLFLVSFLQERGVPVRGALAKKNIVARWAVYYFILFAVLLMSSGLGGDAGEFFYAQY